MADVQLVPVSFNPFAGEGSPRRDRSASGAEAALRNVVMLTPAELAADDAQSRTPANIADLDREIARSKDPRAIAVLQEERQRITGSRGTQIASELKAKREPVFPVAAAAQVSLVPVDFDPFAAPKEQPGVWSDIKNTLNIGFQGMALDAREVARRTLGDTAVGAIDTVDKWLQGKPSEELLKGKIKQSQEALTPEMSAALQKTWWDDKAGTLGSAWSDPRSYLGGLMQSLPGTVATMGPSLALARAAYTAQIAAKVSPQIAAAKAATTAQLAGGLTEGLQQAGQSARTLRDEILAMDKGQLSDSQVMKAMMAEGLPFEQARAKLAEDASAKAMVIAGVATGVFGGAGDRMLAKAFTSGLSGNMLARAGKGAVAEGVLEEFPQSYLSKVGENIGKREATPSTPITEGALGEGLGGAAIGGVMGGGMGAAGRREAALPPPTVAQPPSTPPSSGAAAVPAPQEGGTQPADLPPDAARAVAEGFHVEPPPGSQIPTVPFSQTDVDLGRAEGHAGAEQSRQEALRAAGEPLPYESANPAVGGSPLEQARMDAQILQSGGSLAGADQTRVQNATLMAVYGENAAVRHAIEAPELSGIRDAMLAVAPTVERVRGTIQQGQETRDITQDVVQAVDELAQMRAAGISPAQVMAHGVRHDISYEGQQLLQFLSENQGRPQALARFMEDYLQIVEDMGGAPSTVRGRAFDIIQERNAARRQAVETEKAQAKEKAFQAAEVAREREKRVQETKARAVEAEERPVREIKRAEAAGSGIQPGATTAMALAFEQAQLRKTRAKPSAETAGAVQNGATGSAESGAVETRGQPTGGSSVVSESPQARDAGNAQPVRERSAETGVESQAAPEGRPGEDVSRASQIVAERKTRETLSKIMVRTKAIEAETGRRVIVTERADTALADVNHQIQVMEALLECLA